MLDPRKLRIGNLVDDSHLGISEVVALSLYGNPIIKDNHGGGVPCFDLSPIVLTDSWMEKFGFNSVGSRYFRRDFIGIDYLEWDNITNELWLTICLGEDENSLKLEHIKYVHQLQNLYFALTGKELELKP